MARENDEQLLAAIREGDTAAVGVLLERHAPTVYRFGLRMCRDPEDAKDVLQDTLLAAAGGLRDFRGGAALSTWLYTVARSFCIKKRRTSKHAPKQIVPLDDREAALAPERSKSPEEATSDRELGEMLERAIAALEPESREVLLLRDVEGLTAPQVAEIVGASVDAVKSRLHRARTQVRAALRQSTEPSLDGCPDVVTSFSRHLDGDLDAADCAAMQAHVASCKRCGAACDALKETLSLCQAARQEELPPAVQQLIRDALRKVVDATPR